MAEYGRANGDVSGGTKPDEECREPERRSRADLRWTIFLAARLRRSFVALTVMMLWLQFRVVRAEALFKLVT